MSAAKVRGCSACGGAGWLPSRTETPAYRAGTQPNGADCPYCRGTGKDTSAPLSKRLTTEEKSK